MRVQVGAATVDCVSGEEAAERILALACKEAGASLVVTPNLHHLELLERDPALVEAYGTAALVLADGWPVAALASVISHRRVHRVCGSGLIEPLAQHAAATGKSMAIIGGPGRAAEEAAERLCRRHAGLHVAFFDAATPGFDEQPTYIDLIRRQLREARPDIVIFGVGAPRQEVFAARYMLDLPIGVIVCVGAGIAFTAGQLRRAPRVVQAIGAEWLFRLITEPTRLTSRYVSGVAFLVRRARPIIRKGAVV